MQAALQIPADPHTLNKVEKKSKYKYLDKEINFVPISIDLYT